MTSRSSSSVIEDMYRESLDENFKIVTQFPVTFQSALMLSETMSPAENAVTNVKMKTAVSECLNALREISRISGDLELLGDT